MQAIPVNPLSFEQHPPHLIDQKAYPCISHICHQKQIPVAASHLIHQLTYKYITDISERILYNFVCAMSRHFYYSFNKNSIVLWIVHCLHSLFILSCPGWRSHTRTPSGLYYCLYYKNPAITH